MMRGLVAGLVSTLVAGLLVGAQSQPAAAAPAPDPVTWLCQPGLRSNPCEIAMDTTAQRATGRDRVFTPRRVAPSKRPIDCFYVYPTVSNQPTPTATKAKDPEIRSIAKYQASRYSTRCRVFAPVYRQVTLAGIPALALGGLEKGYADVVQAWRTYLKRYNKGRGVVLIGHSQGTILLRQLIRTQIDPKRAVRRKLVGALLLGGNMTVADGRSRGGDFRHVRTCTRTGQVGCVVAYSTYSTDPLVSFFGTPTSTSPLPRSTARAGPDSRSPAPTPPG